MKMFGRMLVVAFLTIFFMIGFTGLLTHAVSAGETDKKNVGYADFQHLEGHWLRTDGGYVLELRDIKKDGSVKASYYNPRSINVSRAKLSQQDGGVHLFVELRDINYPGSTYNLQYDAISDQLKGKYFQAIEKLTFDIEFVRIK